MYANRYEAALRLAQLLIDNGVNRSDIFVVAGIAAVVVAVVAILAVLRARAAYVPIDPSVPPARARQVLEDSGAQGQSVSVLIVDADLPDDAGFALVERLAAQGGEGQRGDGLVIDGIENDQAVLGRAAGRVVEGLGGTYLLCRRVQISGLVHDHGHVPGAQGARPEPKP